jgi:STE24 endopeptidase
MFLHRWKRGELKDKIWKLQEDSKKKVKEIYIYNESKKSTTKNAFLIKLPWRREFGIADNFINENAEDELLAVLSHEVGHLKHKKNIWDFIGYGFCIIFWIAIVCIVANPQICLWINAWVRDSFGIAGNNYYLIMVVYLDIITPIMFLIRVYGSYQSRCAEYEADREAVRNGYAEEMIHTFKSMSKDELINVNPHPFIEFTEYSHPGMYHRIKAIRAARALRELSDEAAVNGTSEMSLDEINAEISAVRNGGCKKG